MHIIIKLKKLFIKRWIIGKNTQRVIIDFETIGNGFYDDAGARYVGDNPVKLGGWKLLAKGKVGKVDFGK